MDKLTTHKALAEFFREKIREALETQKLKISEEVEFYLVHILTHFSRSENLYHYDNEGHPEARPLALKLYDSLFAASTYERFSHLKSLGDTALYHAGVFYEGLYNKMVDVEYYINMGELAYNSLANLNTVNNKNLSEMFFELSQQFADLAEVLNICCEQEKTRSDSDILKLLDRYLRTGSEKAKELLEDEGISPVTIIGNPSVQ